MSPTMLRALLALRRDFEQMPWPGPYHTQTWRNQPIARLRDNRGLRSFLVWNRV